LAEQWRDFVTSNAMSAELYEEVEAAFAGASEKSSPYGMESFESLPPRELLRQAAAALAPRLAAASVASASAVVAPTTPSTPSFTHAAPTPAPVIADAAVAAINNAIFAADNSDAILATVAAGTAPLATPAADSIVLKVATPLMSTTTTSTTTPVPPSALPRIEKPSITPASAPAGVTKAKKQKTQATTMLSFFQKQPTRK
jgi:hypothetical protein